MRSILGLATFAIGALCWFVTQSKASSHHCSACAERPGASPRGAFGFSGVSLKASRSCSILQER